MKAHTCRTCRDNDPSVQYRRGYGMLCSACHIDARTSTVRRVPVPERIMNDRYAQMATRFGVS